MKKTLLALLSAFLICTVYAQDKAVQEVENSVENFRQALVNADSTALEKLLDKDLTYGHSSGKVEGKASLISSLTSGASDFVTIDLTEQSVLIKGKTAIVRHILSASTNDNGNPSSIRLKIMLVWQKAHGKWVLIGRQAVKA